MRLTLRQIEAFRAIMQAGSITRAAELLHVSQPAVSVLLANMETVLGYRLFRRQRGRLVPTGEAEALYPEIERAFVGLDEISLAAAAIGQMQAGVLRLVAMPVFAGPPLSDVIARFANAHPGVSIVYEVQPRLTILNWVATHRCDLGISIEPADHPGVESRPLASGAAVCVLPRGHRLARKPKITASDLDGERLISLPAEARSRQELDRLLERSGARPVRRVETRTNQALWQLVERGVGVGVVSRFALAGVPAERVTVRPFEPAFVSQALMLNARDRPPSRIVSAFCAQLQACCDTLEKI